LRKISLTLAIVVGLAVLVVGGKVAAKNSVGAGQMQQNEDIEASSIGVQVKNQNQVTTQNEGEDSELQIETAEKESTEEGRGEGLLKRSPVAIEHMSLVAQKVQELLQIKTTGGIGDQVREIAREQDMSQTQVQEQINKIDSKGQLAKSLFGPDYKALKSMNQIMEQNQLRIQALEELQNQLTNQADKTTIEETIQALIQQNTSLEEAIMLESQTKSLFGWLVKLFVK